MILRVRSNFDYEVFNAKLGDIYMEIYVLSSNTQSSESEKSRREHITSYVNYSSATNRSLRFVIVSFSYSNSPITTQHNYLFIWNER